VYNFLQKKTSLFSPIFRIHLEIGVRKGQMITHRVERVNRQHVCENCGRWTRVEQFANVHARDRVESHDEIRTYIFVYIREFVVVRAFLFS